MAAVDWLEMMHVPLDTGCDLAPRCLECPLPLCRFDLPPKRAGALVHEAQLRTLVDQGLTADEAAAEMGVSRRTVFRLAKGLRAAGEVVIWSDTPRPLPYPTCEVCGYRFANSAQLRRTATGARCGWEHRAEGLT